MFKLVGPLGFKRLIYCIYTADITGTEFQSRACYSVLAAAAFFSTAVCVYVFLDLLVVDFLVNAKSENKHISFHLMYFRQIKHSPIIVTEQGVRGNRSGYTAIVSRLTAREPAVIGGSTVRPLLGVS
jgi:hypothetical protein